MTSSIWDSVSRELVLSCDAEGRIAEADARATRLLDAKVGASLLDLAVEGTETKVRALLAQAVQGPVDRWEVSLVSEGVPSTVVLSTRPGPERTILVHGLVSPPGYEQSVRQLNESMEEIVELNREIGRGKKALEKKNAELVQAYRELDESNRGVMTLHAELAERADNLKRAADVRGRVVANVSHEFRTPLHTILGLSKLLLEGADGPLTTEQEKQVRFVRASAEELSQLVGDLLDLSKAESGTAVVRPTEIAASELFAALRGQLRPLVPADGKVRLEIVEPETDVVLKTDQGKVSQILRNLVTNALKFTEEGDVRVSFVADAEQAVFRVSDSGIGIAREHQELIFEEFGQVEGPRQARTKGIGLGLPLSRKLAEILGGTLVVESRLGKGSTFVLTIPRSHPEERELERIAREPLDPNKAPVLVVEDDRKTIFIYDKYLSMAGFQVVPARNTDDARDILKTLRPAAIVLDVMLEGESTWAFLGELKRNDETKDIPVLVVTVTSGEQKARALGADEFWLKPVDQDRLLRKLKTISRSSTPARVLVIDDDARARYLLRKYLEKSPYEMLEASTGHDGVACAREKRPHVILLDFLLEEMTAFDVLDELKSDPRTRSIPVVIVTSHVLDARQRERLAEETSAIVSKESLSRELAINRIRDALSKAGLSHTTEGQR